VDFGKRGSATGRQRGFPRQKNRTTVQPDEEGTPVDIRAFFFSSIGNGSIKPAPAARIVAQVALPVGAS
jgi:hypothetical protein